MRFRQRRGQIQRSFAGRRPFQGSIERPEQQIRPLHQHPRRLGIAVGDSLEIGRCSIVGSQFMGSLRRVTPWRGLVRLPPSPSARHALQPRPILGLQCLPTFGFQHFTPPCFHRCVAEQGDDRGQNQRNAHASPPYAATRLGKLARRRLGLACHDPTLFAGKPRDRPSRLHPLR